MGADTFLTISEDCPSSLVEAVSTAAHLGKRGHRGKLQYHSLTSTQGLMLMPGQGLRDSRDTQDRGLGPGLTQRGLGDSRDRDLGPGGSLNRGTGHGDSRDRGLVVLTLTMGAVLAELRTPFLAVGDFTGTDGVGLDPMSAEMGVVSSWVSRERDVCGNGVLARDLLGNGTSAGKSGMEFVSR